METYGLTSVTSRPPMSRAELMAVKIACTATVGFGLYGFATGAPSTVTYVLSVAAVGLVIRRLRRTPIPGPLAIALAVQAIAHLAGGLVRVGNDVLYNASIGTHVASLHTHVLQYDHLVHTFGTFVGTLTLWTLLVPPSSSSSSSSCSSVRRDAVVLCVLAGLGVGAINETIEFLATIAHSGAHVGGYTNTGWDFVSNTIGALAAAAVIQRVRVDEAAAS